MNLFYKRSTLYILLISTVIVAVLMFLQGSPMKAGEAGGILSLEFAPTKMDVEAVLEIWEEESTPGTNIINTAINNTRLDFIFLLCYSFFLFTCVKQLSVYFSAKNIFRFMAAAALLAGLLDIVENIGMLQSLDGNISDKTAFITAVAAYFKWILVIVVIVFLIISFVVKLARKKE